MVQDFKLKGERMKATERIGEIQTKLKTVGPEWLAAKRAFDLINSEFQDLHCELHKLQKANLARVAYPPAKKKQSKSVARPNTEKTRKMLENLEKSGFSEEVKNKMAEQLGLTRKRHEK